MIEMAIGSIVNIIDKLIPDKNEAERAKLKLLELQQQGQLSELSALVELNKNQLVVNANEASNPSLFVSGWRPFIGWTCGIGLFWQFVGYPLVSFFTQIAGYTGEIPSISTDYLLELTLGMLGMGGLRMYEKIKGVART